MRESGHKHRRRRPGISRIILGGSSKAPGYGGGNSRPGSKRGPIRSAGYAPCLWFMQVKSHSADFLSLPRQGSYLVKRPTLPPLSIRCIQCRLRQNGRGMIDSAVCYVSACVAVNTHLNCCGMIGVRKLGMYDSKQGAGWGDWHRAVGRTSRWMQDLLVCVGGVLARPGLSASYISLWAWCGLCVGRSPAARKRRRPLGANARSARHSFTSRRNWPTAF